MEPSLPDAPAGLLAEQARPLSLVSQDQGAAPEPAAALDLTGLSVSQILALYGRQADELARTVEAAISEEDALYQRQLAMLREQHQRRRVVLVLLADALGQQNADLDEAAHQVVPASAGGAR